jgi:DNA-binding beta-propeller fold protein YncE
MRQTNRSVVTAIQLGLFFLALPAATPAFSQSPDAPTAPTRDNAFLGNWVNVGHQPDGWVQTPVNQTLTPYGKQLDLPGMRPQALALSHHGNLIAVSGKTNQLVIVDPMLGEIRQTVSMPGAGKGEAKGEGDQPTVDAAAQVSYTGLIFSPDDRSIFLSDVNGSIKVFSVANDGTVAAERSIRLPPANAPRRAAEIPSGLAVSSDGSTLYVCGNLSNRLLEINRATGDVMRSWPVGVAPYDVVLVDAVAVVSNWGGRRPDDQSVEGPAGRGTTVRVDPVRFIASEGSVSLIDLTKSDSVKEVVTGRHASALAVSPDKRFVVCANAADDFLSVIDVSAQEVVHSIWAKPSPADLFGAQPNAIAFNATGDRLYVANGSQNAIGVIEFLADELDDSKLVGLIPVGWYPAAIVVDQDRNSLCVANVKGLPKTPKRERQTGAEGFNTHHYSGSLSIFEVPAKARLPELSALVARNMRKGRIEQALQPARANQPPRAIPLRIGEPSLIKHVVYVIKENRTYDQIFGALKRGRGRADLCIFGRNVTPNQHKMVDEFVLLDNTYCAGILSADGHQWSTSAISTDYMEKSFARFPRSYPDGMGEDDIDALAYSPAGFIWDNAVAHGKTIRNYGEFMMPRVRYRDPARTGTPDFLSCYRTWKGESDEVIFASEPGIESIRSFSPTGYVGWEMSVPDQYRADFIIKEVKEFDRRGEFPQLTIICLPNDHASGTRAGCPTPDACMADNDLAFGRIVEALSHTQFWSEMAILGIEDDPQAGWDHISGYRTTAYVISPFSKRGALVQTQYNTTSVLRTIEQILGLPPMNQFDASAVPMFDCFVEEPDCTPFDAVANKVPLEKMNPEPAAISDPQLREDAIVSAQLNFAEVDRAPEDVLNRILWRAMKGTSIPYPRWAAGVDEDDLEFEE